MFTFDSEEEERACKHLIRAGEICKHCGHNHSGNKDGEPCKCVVSRPEAIMCVCDTFEPFVSDLWDAMGVDIE